jgi:hypothetical protein
MLNTFLRCCRFCHAAALLLPSRKAHKKDQVTEVARKKRRTASKATARAIVGVSLEVINKKRTEKPEVRLQGGGVCKGLGVVAAVRRV